MIGKLYRIYCSTGFRGLGYAIGTRLQSLVAGKARAFTACVGDFADRRGIEIGGPSRSFSATGIFPVYPIAGSVDNCTFGNLTVWEGSIQEGRSFQYSPGKPAGMQFISEATDLQQIASATYDFVLASHVLERIANPILALSEWVRVLREGGVLVLLLPEQSKTFDHRRPVTTMEHLMSDFNAGTGEDDLTHLEEILALHGLSRDPEAGNPESFNAARASHGTDRASSRSSRVRHSPNSSRYQAARSIPRALRATRWNGVRAPPTTLPPCWR